MIVPAGTSCYLSLNYPLMYPLAEEGTFPFHRSEDIDEERSVPAPVESNTSEWYLDDFFTSHVQELKGYFTF